MDFREGFTAIKLTAAAARLLTFVAPDGRKIRYNVGCYGPRDLPLHFHKAIDEHIVQPALTGVVPPGIFPEGEVLEDLSPHVGKSQWVDDICFGVHNTADPAMRRVALELLRRFLVLCIHYGVRINLSKSHFNARTATTLGLITDGTKVWLDPERLGNLTDLPIPRTIEQLRAGLGMFGYFRFAVPASTFIEPFGLLSQLNREPYDPGLWTEAHTKAWRGLGGARVTAAAWYLPDWSRPVYVKVDACNSYGWGVLLLQYDDEGRPRIIAHRSVGWKDKQRDWPPNTKEAYALHHAVMRVAPRYAPGAEVYVETDHKNAMGAGMYDSDDPLVRTWWGEMCAAEHFYYHVPGPINAADFPSRYAQPEERTSVPQPRLSPSSAATPPPPPPLASIPPPRAHAALMREQRERVEAAAAAAVATAASLAMGAATTSLTSEQQRAAREARAAARDRSRSPSDAGRTPSASTSAPPPPSPSPPAATDSPPPAATAPTPLVAMAEVKAEAPAAEASKATAAKDAS